MTSPNQTAQEPETAEAVAVLKQNTREFVNLFHPKYRDTIFYAFFVEDPHKNRITLHYESASTERKAEAGQISSYEPMLRVNVSALPVYTALYRKTDLLLVVSPTPCQIDLIKQGVYDTDASLGRVYFRTYFDPVLGGHTNSFAINNPEESLIAVVYSPGFTLSKKWGPPLLAVGNHQSSGGLKHMYQTNTFVCSTIKEPYFNGMSIHDANTMKVHPEFIPGLRKGDGTHQTKQEIDRNMRKMFNVKAPHTKFFYQDPLTSFLMKIGKENSALIQTLILEGVMKTVPRTPMNNKPPSLGFAQLLEGPYKTILREVCPNLKSVTLKQATGLQFWDDDTPRDMSNDDRIYQVIGNFAQGIPQLQAMYLGSYGSKTLEQQKEMWGSSTAWIDKVKNGEHRPAPPKGTFRTGKRGGARKGKGQGVGQSKSTEQD